MTSLEHSTHKTCTAPRPNASLWTRLRASFSLGHQRHTLKALDADALRDIGVSRADADAEAARPVWDVPQHWRA